MINFTNNRKVYEIIFFQKKIERNGERDLEFLTSNIGSVEKICRSHNGTPIEASCNVSYGESNFDTDEILSIYQVGCATVRTRMFLSTGILSSQITSLDNQASKSFLDELKVLYRKEPKIKYLTYSNGKLLSETEKKSKK